MKERRKAAASVQLAQLLLFWVCWVLPVDSCMPVRGGVLVVAFDDTQVRCVLC